MYTTSPNGGAYSFGTSRIVLAQSTGSDFLTGYQDAAYAARYAAFVETVRAAEAKLGGTRLSEAVARYLFKLMAYKDEYEVARLHTDPAFTAKIADMFEGDYKLVHHLAPPLTAKTNAKGELLKQPFGPWMRSAFGVLAKLKGLRGGALDVFGRSEERRMERALITEYEACISELLKGLTAERLALAIEIARIPEDIRGYGHVKARHLASRPAEVGNADGALAQRRDAQASRLTVRHWPAIAAAPRRRPRRARAAAAARRAGGLGGTCAPAGAARAAAHGRGRRRRRAAGGRSAVRPPEPGPARTRPDPRLARRALPGRSPPTGCRCWPASNAPRRVSGAR